MKIIFFLMLGFFSMQSMAQCDDSIHYSEVDQESFVKTYLALKEEQPKTQDQALFDLASKHNISPEQYRELQDQTQIKRSLTSNEQSFVADIQKMKEKHGQEVQNIEERICKDNNLSMDVYHSMKKQYRSCMKFQRSLAHYFKKLMK